MIDPGRDRGQMLLVGAVAIAVLVFGVVVVLNTMIYTTSVKPQASIEAAEESMTAEQVIRRDLKRFVRGYTAAEPYINQSNTNALEANLTRYGRRQAEFTAERGPATVAVELNRTASESAALVRQSNKDEFRNYSSTGPGAHDWNITDGGELTSVRFEFEAKTSASYPQAFTVELRNHTTGDWWRFKVYKTPPSTTTIETLDDDGNAVTCTVPRDETVVVNETAIAAPSNTCAIDFGHGVPPDYSVRITKGQKLSGTYALRLTDVNEAGLGDRPANQPYLDDLLTEAAFDFRYVTPRITYESRLRIDIRSLMMPRIGGTATLGRESGVTVRANGSVVTYEVTDPEARESYESLIAPRSGALLAYDDFESGGTGAWTTTGGTGGVDDGTSHTGRYALYHNVANGTMERTTGVNTTGYDAVVVEYWAQEGLRTFTPDAGPEPSEGENMTLQYYNASGGWTEVDRTLAVDGSPPTRYERRVYIDAADARHDGFRLRFVAPADAPSDHWYVDDVRILGREER